MTDEDLIVDLNRLFWLLEEDRQYLARANTARLAARRIQAQAAEIERLRGDLAKAVEAGKTMDDGCDCERCNQARTTLAALTGAQKDGN